MDAPIIFLDCETDGLRPASLPWEFAGIRRDPDGTERTFHCYIDIEIHEAEPKGLEIGGFYKRHPMGRWLAGDGEGDRSSNAPHNPPETTPVSAVYANLDWYADDPVTVPFFSPKGAARYVARATHGAHIVGANPAFDQDVLARFLRDNGVIPAWSYHLIDVYALALGCLRGRGEEVEVPWRGSDLRDRLGVPVPDSEVVHTALGDALWARDMYDTVMGT